jgi:outer membrane beta-barrel protein
MKAALGALLLALLWARPILAQSTEQEAGDVSEIDKDRMGPLRERIPPVSGHSFLKKGRFELSPSASLSVKDSFFTKYMFGGSLTYHPLETLGVGLRFAYSIPVVSGSAQICQTDASGNRTCRSPQLSEISGRAPGQIKLLGGLDLQWAPIYGKMSLFAEHFLRFDLYGIGGVAAIQYVGPGDSGSGTSEKWTIGGNGGLGMRFFFNRWITLRTELRDLIYVETTSVSPSKSSVRQQIVFELGLSFFFPTAFSES